HEPQGRRHVSGKAIRVRTHGEDFFEPVASVHNGLTQRRSSARPGLRAEENNTVGGDSIALGSAERLSLPNALSVREGFLCREGTRVQGGDPGTFRLLPLLRRDRGE